VAIGVKRMRNDSAGCGPLENKIILGFQKPKNPPGYLLGPCSPGMRKVRGKKPIEKTIKRHYGQKENRFLFVTGLSLL